MSVQDSTFKTVHVLDNEIIKANDFEFAFEQIVENVCLTTQMFLESDQDFVINGKVILDSGMNLKVSPIYGVCKSTNRPFGRTETTDETIAIEGSNSGRVDIIEVRGEWKTYDNQQRAFNDPETDTKTYQYVDTKKLMRPVYVVKKGVEGAGVAPDVDEGFVKLAEISVRAGISTLAASDIHNITSNIAGKDNDDWTNEKDATYNIGYISEINERFDAQHNLDGTHKDNVINTDSLNIGTGTKQINGNVLPVGGNVSVPTQTISPSDSILSVFTKTAAMITTIYNTYLKYGDYGFKGNLSVSAIADENNDLTKPITIIAPGDGTASIQIDGNTVLSIDINGKLSTNGYTATSANHIITKSVTDAITTSMNLLANRVSALEESQQASNSNVVLSAGEDGQFNAYTTAIQAATTENITLSGSQAIDGVTLTDNQLVLVKNQTDKTENGIYAYSSSTVWQRAIGLDTPSDIKGKIFRVIQGNVNKGKMFYTLNNSFVDSESFGTDAIILSEYFGAVEPLANRLVMRDSNGRAQVAAPVNSCDIARKAEIDALYGSSVGCPLGTAAVGTATTFARSDHVHPIPNHVYSSYITGAGTQSICCTCAGLFTCATSNSIYTRLVACCYNKGTQYCSTVQVCPNAVCFSCFPYYGSSGYNSCIMGNTYYGNVCGCWNGKTLACVEAAGWTCFCCPVCYCNAGCSASGFCIYKNACTSEGRICINTTNVGSCMASYSLCNALKTLWSLPAGTSGCVSCSYAAEGYIPDSSTSGRIIAVVACRCYSSCCFGITYTCGFSNAQYTCWITGYLQRFGCPGFYICKPV